MINKVQSCHYTIVVAVIVIIFVLTTVTLFPFIYNSPSVPDSDGQSSKNFHEKEGKLIEPDIVCNCDLPPINHSDSVPQSTGHVVAEGKNYAVIFTGRWKFLRFLIPYLVQSLRMNGGVIDKIVFMMILYDAETHNSLLNFAKVAHDFLGKNVFEFEYLGYEPGKVPQSTRIYRDVYYNLFSRLIEHPYDKYFKLDDDIVYIHPGTFKHMIENKNSSHCFMHFANIVCNWRCNYMHMEMGVFDEEGLNPRGLKFDFDPIGKCGWESPECAQLCLRTFLHHYHNERLDKYMFKGLKQLTKRKRFSIHLHLFDKDLINFKALLETGPIQLDDEGWWTQEYAINSAIKQPNCIVGEALVVHFSYSVTMKEMLDLNLLEDFETILKSVVGAKMDQVLWTALGFGKWFSTHS